MTALQQKVGDLQQGEAYLQQGIAGLQEGAAQTRVEDIVEDTGYGKGSFYFHFPNKLDCSGRSPPTASSSAATG